MKNREAERNEAQARPVDRRRFLKIGGGVVAAGAGAFLLPGCGGDKNTLKIVSSLPRTGSAQGQTDTIVNGIRMAMDEYPDGLFGQKIVHIDKDDATAAQGQWDAGKEADNAREAVGDKDVMVFIGPYNSGASMVSQPILSEVGLLQISPAATWPGLTKKVPGNPKDEPAIHRKDGKKNFCRVCPTDFVQGPLSAVFAKEVLNVKKVFVLDDKELYGNGIAGLFKKKCEELGIAILGHESIVASQKNFKTVIQAVKNTKPDLLYFGGTSQSGGPQIAIDMKGEGLTCPLMVPDGCYENAFIEGAGADLFNAVPCYATIGGYDPAQMLAAGGSGAEFVNKYKAKYGKDPEAYAVYGYEAAKVFLEGAKKVGSKNREEILKAVLATKDFSAGAVGKWSFDEDGDTSLKVLTISKIEGGKFKPQKTITQ